jgi:hypothetical protein
MSEEGWVVVVGVVLWCACGTFFAWLFGIKEGITWLLFVVAWPVPLGVAIVVGIFVLTVSMSCARALVR